MARAQAAASDPRAGEAIESIVASGGNAVDAVLGGFLAAAATRPGVLLGPICAMVGGVGVGARLFDGRVCQPGKEAPRPRGFRQDEPIPPAARAAAPRSLATLALVHAYGAARPMSALARPAIAAAKKAEAPERAALLDAVSRQGALALVGSDTLRALLRVAGPTAGGLLSEADLRGARPGDAALTFLRVGTDGLELAPFAAAEANGEVARRRTEILVAADGRGKVAALAFCPDDDGVEVPELGVTLARDAEPIRRGVPRVTPGTVRAMAVPIAIARRPAEGWFAALGVAGAAGVEIEAASPLATAGALAGQLEALRVACGGTTAMAATTQRQQTAVLRVP